jgi:dGTPase
LIRSDQNLFPTTPESIEDIPTILATVGLAHDLGNPPFGHQGEAAIGRWFKKNSNIFLEPGSERISSFEPVVESLQDDFLKFEGNAQTIRLLTRLQNTSGPAGLNLTSATLAALMKYTVRADSRDRSHAASKKHGFHASEEEVVKWIREQTGLKAGQRHPLTWIMEACDDIAYSVLDIEDAIKKGLVSAEDLRAFITHKFSTDEDGGGLMNQLEDDFRRADKSKSSLSRIKEVKASYIRTRLIERLLTGAARAFALAKDEIFSHERTAPLLDDGSFESRLCEALKSFAREHAYQSPEVLKIELQGALVIERLMDAMWNAITNRNSFEDRKSRRESPQAAFVYSKISESYRWQFENNADGHGLPTRYCEAQLLTDMISGMTDGFAVQLDSELTGTICG